MLVGSIYFLVKQKNNLRLKRIHFGLSIPRSLQNCESKQLRQKNQKGFSRYPIFFSSHSTFTDKLDCKNETTFGPSALWEGLANLSLPLMVA